MKAFLINSFKGGGAEKNLQLVLNELIKSTNDIVVFCIENDCDFELNPNIKVVPLQSFIVRNKILSFLLLIPLSLKLSFLIRKLKISSLQSHLFRANYLNILSKIFFGSHKVTVFNHSVISRFENEGLSGKLNLFLIRKLYSYADSIISVSNYVNMDMKTLFPNLNGNVVYNVFDCEDIIAKSKEKIVEMEFKPDRKYMISVGRMIPIKRQLLILNAMATMDRNISLIFIGSGQEQKKLMQLSKDLGLSSRVHFINWVSNPYKFINRANLLLCTSSSESFGNTIIESFLCSTPVISTSCGGPDELLCDNRGFLLSGDDVNSLKEQISVVLNLSSYDFLQNSFDFALEFDVKKRVGSYLL